MKRRKRNTSQETDSLTQTYHRMRHVGCFLCGEPPALMGMFFPPPQLARVLGQGREGFAAYTLCGACAKKDGHSDAVEDKILQMAMTGV